MEEKTVHIEDLKKEDLNKLRINKEELSILEPMDQKYLLIRGAMEYINGLNAMDRSIMETQNLVRTLIPAPMEELKILVSRVDDIQEEEIDNLSSKFLEDTFTINGKKIEVTKPEVGEFKDIDFYRELLKNLKLMDKHVANVLDLRAQINKNYQEDIPKEIQELCMNIEKMDQFMMEYFKVKMNSDKTPEEQKKEYQKRMLYKSYARTLEPIIKSFSDQIAKKNGRDSLLYGFKNKRVETLNAAIEIAKAHHFSFPFNMLQELDVKLTDGKYKKYRNLLIYLIARYIKYKRNDLTHYDIIFLTDLHAILIVLNRPEAEKRYPDLYLQLQTSVNEVLSLATGIQ